MERKLFNGDCLEVLKGLPSRSVDAVVTDPPAGISFMGKAWDGDKGGREQWVAWLAEVMRECKRVLKPGAHALVWALPRTSHWTATALEDAGFEVRDVLVHLFGTGFPKSHNLDGGLGTALKPAAEHWILARVPLEGTVARNAAKHGTGALNIDACRVGTEVRYNPPAGNKPGGAVLQMGVRGMPQDAEGREAVGRWPANVLLSGDAPGLLDAQSGYSKSPGKVTRGASRTGNSGLAAEGRQEQVDCPSDEGGASRFFYVAKSSRRERGEGNDHPTVKPLALMQWLVRLVTPPGGTVLDPFMGSGTTGMACEAEGFGFIGIEQDPHYCELAAKRIGGGRAVEVGAAAPREEDSVAKGRTVKARDNENEHDSDAVEHVSYRLTVKRTDDAVRAAVGEYGAVEVSVSIHRGLQAGQDDGEAWETLKADVHAKVNDAFLSLGVVPEEE